MHSSALHNYKLHQFDIYKNLAYKMMIPAQRKVRATDRGARTHDHKVKSLALYRLS